MCPLYEDGDFVIVSRIPLISRRIEPGDVIVFRHPAYGTMIKMVESAEGQKTVCVIGTCAASTDSRNFGAMSLKDMVGKVILRIRKT